MYTGRGDGGETSLLDSRRVPKSHALVEAYGDIDELNSLLGVVRSECRDRSVANSLLEVQRLLFVAGADASSELKGPPGAPKIAPDDTERIEEMTKSLLKGLPTLRNFIVPGGSRTGAQLQLARAVCRRTERHLVAAKNTEALNPALIPFFNRLSSYLFNLSRVANERAGKKDEVWNGATRGSRRRS